jgi:hypothetical protein
MFLRQKCVVLCATSVVMWMVRRKKGGCEREGEGGVGREGVGGREGEGRRVGDGEWDKMMWAICNL